MFPKGGDSDQLPTQNPEHRAEPHPNCRQMAINYVQFNIQLLSAYSVPTLS